VSPPLPAPALIGEPARLSADSQALRAEVRAFLGAERAAGAFTPRCDGWLNGWDEDFSRKLGQQGWLGMTIPAAYGGQDASALDRYVVTEELLAAGAPVAAHWIADRQIAPALLRYGNETLKQRYLASIACGECYFAIGLSEPDAGSDLAAIRATATRADGGWNLSGTKIWTSGAHRAHAFFVLARCGPPDGRDRHQGLTQFVVELTSLGVDIRPIRLLTGEHHFNEVVMDNVFVPDNMVLGAVGAGWHQVTSELAFERGGPERLLSTFPLLAALIGQIKAGRESDRALGSLVSRLWALRQMSLAVAQALSARDAPAVPAALVKDLGTRLESEIVTAARMLVEVEPDPSAAGFPRLLAEAVLHAPGFTLRGGTNEILRGVVARALGLR
jgi:Acyl-CoA dehydrogenase, N-terminal domain/Acyl-CoA dehydrogenase, middle domain